MVKISTGLSAQQADGIVPIDTAIALLKDMGGSSVKFFPMGGSPAAPSIRQWPRPVPATASGWSPPAASILRTSRR
jgi:hypothetical protein